MTTDLKISSDEPSHITHISNGQVKSGASEKVCGNQRSLRCRLNKSVMRRNIIKEIRDYWGWTGIDPVEIVGENDFGNLMIKDAQGKYWRLCPEDLYCEVVANDRADLDELSKNQCFLHSWHMRGFAEEAQRKLGRLDKGKKYCLKIPAPLGGEYGSENVSIISQLEQIRF